MSSLRGNALRAAAKDAINTDSRAAIREWLLQPARIQRWQDAFDARLDAHERDAVRLYPELLGWVGAERDLVIILLQRYGLQSESQLSQVVERANLLDQLDPDSAYRSCLEYVSEYRRDHGLPPLVSAGERVEGAVLPAVGENGAAPGSEAEP